MSIVAISQALGGLGDDIGREVGRLLSYEFVDREIILQAAERFGQGVRDLERLTEEKPTLWERFAETQLRYVTCIEAVIWEMAARDKVVLVGRGAPFVLRKVRHALRVWVSAPERLRGERVAQQSGDLTGEVAVGRVRQSDQERAARVRFLYHVDWDDPLMYDLALNTERLGANEGARVIQEALRNERFQPTPDSLAEVGDLSLTAQATAALLANPMIRSTPILVACSNGMIALRGTVDAAQVWEAAQDTVARVPGVTGVRNEITVVGYGAQRESSDEELSHGGFRHGEARSWGGYGGGWYDREWEALKRYRASRGPDLQGERPERESG